MISGRLRRVVVWIIVVANLVSIFFNIRWTKEHDFDRALELFVGSNVSLLISTLLSLIALAVLDYSQRASLDWQCLDEELKPNHSSDRYLRLAFGLSVIACSFPELNILLAKLWLKLLT